MSASTERMAVFEPYGVPSPSIAVVCRAIDDTAEAALRRDNTRLRREAANQRACAEAERAESARLRGECQRLAAELATAKALAMAGGSR
ncbi:hypothetical protein [Mycobacterium asiaticum]|uniref:Uncharacterized protein n=1 Tax=Mycobacterium asiaticum TaxID=1790 RepID=A0A1A3NK52_MYCAS|nr:hypothetical protein [Mycobacterium asiaticum]OBK22518.1 hypothetical protein A5635_21620 [Mycobacterium asiaticum]